MAAASGTTGGGLGSSVAEALDGKRSYDSLDDRSQTLVRAVWQERICAALESLDLQSEFEAGGERYAALNADGEVVFPRRRRH